MAEDKQIKEINVLAEVDVDVDRAIAALELVHLKIRMKEVGGNCDYDGGPLRSRQQQPIAAVDLAGRVSMAPPVRYAGSAIGR